MKISTLFILTFILLGTFSSIPVNAQTPIAEAVRRADEPPSWPNCDPLVPDCTKSRMADFIAANLQIPLEAKAENAGGLVMMEFVVEKNGSVGEVKAVHDPGLGLGEEATRVINLMKTKKIKWEPAIIDGKRVAYRYTVPVSFNLNMPPKPEANTQITTPKNDNTVYDVVEEMPRYTGCTKPVEGTDECTFSKVVSFIKTNLKYPEEALTKKVDGQVVATFVIDTNGAVINPVITQGLGYGCDAEVLRILSLMPAWIPGRQDGQAVKVSMTLPVMFQLPKEKVVEEEIIKEED